MLPKATHTLLLTLRLKYRLRRPSDIAPTSLTPYAKKEWHDLSLDGELGSGSQLGAEDVETDQSYDSKNT
jgi:hypothetical protein